MNLIKNLIKRIKTWWFEWNLKRNYTPDTYVYEDDEILAFHDSTPVAPVHVLIIPKMAKITGPSGILESDSLLIGKMVFVATEIARNLGIDKSGFRLVMNNGLDAGQTVPHIHLHLLGGETLLGLA